MDFKTYSHGIPFKIPLHFQKYSKFDPERIKIYSDPYPCKHILFFKRDKKCFFRAVRYIGGKSVPWDDANGAIEIPLSASCILKDNGIEKSIFVSKKDYEDLYEELILCGKSFFTGPRQERFLTLYRAYESLTDKRTSELNSIRHGLSHPHTKLTNKKTCHDLKRLFGTTKIDLSKYKHNKIFFYYFASLIMETDTILYNKLINLLPDNKNLLNTYYFIGNLSTKKEYFR